MIQNANQPAVAVGISAAAPQQDNKPRNVIDKNAPNQSKPKGAFCTDFRDGFCSRVRCKFKHVFPFNGVDLSLKQSQDTPNME